MRVHALAERLTPSAAVRLAVAGLGCCVLGLTGWLAFPGSSGGQVRSGWELVVPALSVWLGPALVSVGAVALLRDGGVLGAAGSVGAAASSVVAWGTALLSAASWGAGFDEADAGLPLSPFSAAFPAFLLAALAAGTLAAAPVWNGLLRRSGHRRGRRLLAALCAVPTAAALGVGALNPATAPAAAVGLVVVARLRAARRIPRRAAATPAADPGPGARRAVAPARLRRTVVRLSALSAALGFPCAAYAVLGETWAPSPGGVTSLPAMNAGLAAGALAALPLVLAAGLLAASRWGRRAAASAAAVAAALVVVCAAQLQGPAGPFGTLLAASFLVGVVAVVPLASRLPGGRAGRGGVAALVAVAASWAALPLPVVFPLVAPFCAVVLALAASGRLPSGGHRWSVAGRPGGAAGTWPGRRGGGRLRR
ncbi:hypothetical protein NUM3379_32870 [Kineococcus sp. NUM-3379]